MLTRTALVALCCFLMDAARAEIVINHPIKTYGLGTVRCVTWSHDGQKVIAGGDQGVISVIDAQTSLVLTKLTGHGRRITSVACSPNGRLLSTGLDGVARVWDLATGVLLTTYEAPEDGGVLSAAMSADGGTVVTGSGSGRVRVWPPDSESKLLFTPEDSGWGCLVDISSDGKTVAACPARQTGYLYLWDVASGAERKFLGHQYAEKLQFSPDDQKLLTAGEYSAKVWDLGQELTFRQFSHPLGPEGTPTQILDAAFSPDGAWLVTAGNNSNGRLWDVATGDFIRHINGTAKTVEFSPDKSKVLGIVDWTVMVWDTDTGKRSGRYHHYTPFRDFALSPTGELFATVAGKSATLYDVVTGNILGSVNSDVNCLDFAPDGEHFVTASYAKNPEIWATRTLEKVAELDHSGLKVRSVDWSDNGQDIVIAGNGYAVFDWNTRQRLAFKTYSDGTTITDVCFMPGGTDRILTGLPKMKSVIIDLASGQPTATFQSGPVNNYLTRVAAFPSGNYVAITGYRTEIWKVTTGQLFRTIDYSADELAISPDGRQIMVSNRLYDPWTGELLVQFMTGNYWWSGAFNAAFHPNGKHILTCNWDSLVQLWDPPLPNAAGAAWRRYR